MPTSGGPAGGHRSQERGFLFYSKRKLETGILLGGGGQGAVLVHPYTECGPLSGRDLPLDCPPPVGLELCHLPTGPLGPAQLKFAGQQMLPRHRLPPAPQVPVHTLGSACACPFLTASSLEDLRKHRMFYSALLLPVGVTGGDQVPSSARNSSPLCVCVSPLVPGGSPAWSGVGVGW